MNGTGALMVWVVSPGKYVKAFPDPAFGKEEVMSVYPEIYT